jgi:uncharacterized protein (TIGR02996 family)
VTTTTTIAAMLRAVRKDRDDDTPRLILADALDETDPSEGGDADWAALIRTQVERGRCENCAILPATTTPAFDCGHDHLRARERALLAAHEARWRRGPACGRCGGKGKIRVRLSSNRHWTRTDPTRRRQNHAPCPDCAGSGWTGPLGDREPGGDARYGGQAGGASRWRVPATFRRGFIHRISTPLADVFAGDTVTEWALAVARWPQVCLEEWGLTDVEFVEREMSSGTRYYPFASSRIPWSVRDEVILTPDGFYGRTTPDAARLALAKAVAAVVNEAAHD